MLAAPPGEWTRDLVSCQDYFQPCPRHCCGHNAREAVLNLWCLSSGGPACSLCMAAAPLETYLQVRRSSYHDVVKMADVSRFADISGIQGYTINSSKVIFLRRRPQPRPPKGAVGASLCTVCSRHLQDVSLFCSLQCKLDGIAGVKNVSLRHLAPLQHAAACEGSSSAAGGGGLALPHSLPGSGAQSSSSGGGGGPDTPLHPASLRGLDAIGAASSDSECMADFHGPPVKRRKGCPLRAPAA